jgi:Ala-tRNA(Pro) deacylase
MRREDASMETTAVGSYLRERGVECDELRHEPTNTAAGEAVRLNIPPHTVAKTLVLDTVRGHALAVIPASERLDMALVHRATGDNHAELASEEELRRDYPDYELGAFPPLGSLLRAPLYVDPKVMDHDTIVFAAGRADISLRARTEELFGVESATVVVLAREYDDKDRELRA